MEYFDQRKRKNRRRKKGTTPEKDILAEARRIANEASLRGITLRFLGGIAFRLRAKSATSPNLKRNYLDIDCVGPRDESSKIEKMFLDLGYTPRTRFNAMNGDRRLIFNDIENERRVDVFLNMFEMSHKLDFSKRLKVSDLTLPLADLLLTKLQVYEITEKEYKDVIALLKDHELGKTDQDNLINSSYIAELCSRNWGLYKTVSLNLDRIEQSLPAYSPSQDELELILSKIEKLRAIIEDIPKTFAWKMRARVGEKVKWYELPEPDKEVVVDSRR